jgi:hypothetical protein
MVHSIMLSVILNVFISPRYTYQNVRLEFRILMRNYLDRSSVTKSHFLFI